MSDPVQDFRLSILASLGHAPEVIQPGRLQRFATSDRRGDTAGWCKLFDDLRGGVFGCHRQSVNESWSAVDRASMTRTERAELARQLLAATAERKAQQRQQWAKNAQSIAQVWAQCVPVVLGDPVALYLKRRGFGGAWPLPEQLRLHRALPYWEDRKNLCTYPAMVVPLIAPNGRTVALHWTYLTTKGQKAHLPSPKKLTGAAGPLPGACIPMHKPERGCIGIAEGIETAFAAWCASGIPTVASYCAGLMATWRWPAGVQRLVIFADHDSNQAGQDAADRLRARALSARLQCEVLTPTAEGADWCDVWKERGAVLIETERAA